MLFRSFLSVDPITTDANTGGLFNRYEYANSNPYRYTDPDGQDSIEDETHLGGRGAAEPFGVPRGIDGGPVRQSIEASRANLQQMRAERLSQNAQQGRQGEAATRKELGDKIAGEQVSIRTSDGTLTRADFVTKGKEVIETKTGNATLSRGQEKLKSDIDAGSPVTPVGRNAEKAGLTPGQPTTMSCCRVDRQGSANGNSGFQGVFQVEGRIDSNRLSKQLDQ